MAEFIYPLYQKYLEYFPLSLPIAMLIKDHLVYIKVMDEAKYFLLFLLRPQIVAIIFSDWNLNKYSKGCLCKLIAFE